MRRVGGEGRGSYSFSPSGAYRGGQSVRGEGRGVGTRVLGNGVRPSDSMSKQLRAGVPAAPAAPGVPGVPAVPAVPAAHAVQYSTWFGWCARCA
jgi:hypothetical protein